MAIRKRYCVVIQLLLIKLLTKDDVDIRLSIVSSLEVLKNDSSHEVSEQAFDCEDQAIIKFKETERIYKMKLDKEKELILYEKGQQEKDLSEEMEEEMKRKQEEEGNKYEMLRQLNDPKVRPRKTQKSLIKIPIQPKNSLKRDSFNDQLILVGI